MRTAEETKPVGTLAAEDAEVGEEEGVRIGGEPTGERPARGTRFTRQPGPPQSVGTDPPDSTVVLRDICKEGDEMLVKVIGIDRAPGKVRLRAERRWARPRTWCTT